MRGDLFCYLKGLNSSGWMGARLPDPDTFTQDGARQQAEGGASSGVEWAEPASVLAWIGAKQDWTNCEFKRYSWDEIRFTLFTDGQNGPNLAPGAPVV